MPKPLLCWLGSVISLATGAFFVATGSPFENWCAARSVNDSVDGEVDPTDSNPPEAAARSPGDHAKSRDKATALVNRLRELSRETVGLHPTAWCDGFVATDDEFRFEGGIFGSKRPVVDPAMRELVQMGVAAVPVLLDHLTDDRPTKLTVELNGAVGVLFIEADYEPRTRNGKSDGRRPPRAGNEPEPGARKYTVKVGDVCFVALGQIVNRGLTAVRYQPTGCMVVNSPVVSPDLAAAARSDWSGLTAEAHEKSLVADAESKSSRRAARAIPRLLYYYPATGEKIALRKLDTSLVNDKSRVDEMTLLVKSLSGIKNERVDRAALNLFRAIDLEKFEGLNRVLADDLALACMRRMTEPKYNEEFINYCEKRIVQLRQHHSEAAEAQRLRYLQDMLKALQGR